MSVQIVFRVSTGHSLDGDARGVTGGAIDISRRLSLVGSIPELGAWSLNKRIPIRRKPELGDGIWETEPVSIPRQKFPFIYRYCANGNRQSPTTRPLVWDLVHRTCNEPPANGMVEDFFEPTSENCDSGWVTQAGVGAFQLRVGQPPGSKEPLVVLENGCCDDEVRVQLYEARPGDPAVPQGKAFATISSVDLGLPPHSEASFSGRQVDFGSDGIIFYMNGQSLDALAFRVDVTAKEDGRLIARAFVSTPTLLSLQGSIAAALVSPSMEQVGVFKAGFLVVTSLEHPYNNLGDLQRAKWSPTAASLLGTLDIGHRGSGASKGRGRSVRENTVLSFQKAATSLVDFIEFDVHVTADGEVVVHHDFDVKLSIGSEVVRLGIPALSYGQLKSTEFTHAMAANGKHASMLRGQRSTNERHLKRNMSSAEDILRSQLKPSIGSPEAVVPNISPNESSWLIADRIATLREAFQDTPPWLGFNIELKYPTDAELAAMPTRWYSRNYFCDAVLRVVLEEGHKRKIIFSSFDPDCATLLSLKCARYPVFFLTCAGSKHYADPRMNSLEAALIFAKSSKLQGVVAEAVPHVLKRLKDVVDQFHRAGLFFFTFGDANNAMEHYSAQRAAGVDAIILDDTARLAKITGKTVSLFHRPLQSPAALEEVAYTAESLAVNQQPALLARLSLGGPLSTVRSGELMRAPSNPVNIQMARSSS
ncbi:hypothetical protein WJX75_009398 [Coccomyxa subellipsoidea]|uniref:glycerophosphodiester phosphodiesterase n=1 Tax=Coccomyxa subellipsoidea TaxID=248742 RepID=A0ABR2YIL7_9CHLO